MRKGRIVVTPRRREQIDTRQLAEAVLAALEADRRNRYDVAPNSDVTSPKVEGKYLKKDDV